MEYRHKRTEYAGRHIPEYWIVDPIAQKVTVLQWVDGIYEAQVYQGAAAAQEGQSSTVASPLYPDLALTTAQLFAIARP